MVELVFTSNSYQIPKGDIMSQPSAPASCPKCSAPNPRYLAFTSNMNKADTYQCIACGLIWTQPSSDKSETQVASVPAG
jgi:hypothetical protein